jgi:4-amino-4-deoxy-L-arabinose transferase-like glycosyltransferase
VGRLTGDEPGGLGNMNFDVGWGRLLGSQMGTYGGWLLPAALICLVAGLIAIGRAPRTDPTRAALILWGGWLLVTAAVFSYANGIVHAYYTVALALAPALGAAVLLVALPRHRTVAALAVVSCLAAPTVYAVQTATVAHTGAMPSVGPAHGGPPGGFGGGLLDSPTPGPGLTDLLSTDAGTYWWTAAVIGSNNAAGYQLAAGAPVIAIGGFNGTDPAPTLAQFERYVADHRIHYFIRGGMMAPHGSEGGSNDAQEIAAWVLSHFPAAVVDNTVVYDLTSPESA